MATKICALTWTTGLSITLGDGCAGMLQVGRASRSGGASRNGRVSEKLQSVGESQSVWEWQSLREWESELRPLKSSIVSPLKSEEVYVGV